MATNPLVPQGTLNRLRGSVVWTDVPQLNVTAAYLGEEMIRLSLEGDAVEYFNTATGAVSSPQPYRMTSLMIHLLKTQQLADLYKQREETNALMGGCTVRPDATPLSPYQLINCSILGVSELNFAGKDPGYGVRIKGYYNINSSLWAAA